MNQDVKALKFILEDFLEKHKRTRIIIEEINYACRSFLYSPLFNRLNIGEFKERLEKQLQSKGQKL